MKKLKSLFILIFILLIIPSHGTKAASLAKPKLDVLSAYVNNAVYLKWKKVKGAKRYEIQRAKVNPKKANKVGKWKKWKVTKKTSIKKKTSGDYKYRVRAIKGSQKGKWSKAKRIFAATGHITDIIYEEPTTIWGIPIEGKLNFRILIKNKTQSQMGFVKPGTQSTIYALDPQTGKTLKSWSGYLYIAETYGYAKTIYPKQEASVYFYCRMSKEEREQYKNAKYMVTASFYPNPYVEPISTQTAITCTNNRKESAVVGK
jgi:hypothetical protein